MGREGTESKNENAHHWEENVHKGLEVIERLSEIILPFFAEKDGLSCHPGKNGSHLCPGLRYPLTLEHCGFKDCSSGGWLSMYVGTVGGEGQDRPHSRFQL